MDQKQHDIKDPQSQQHGNKTHDEATKRADPQHQQQGDRTARHDEPGNRKQSDRSQPNNR
jgi:hypothetical protein